MPKKNGFCLFMEERRPLLEAAGHSIPGGRRDLADLVSEDWKALPEQEKEKYKYRAKKYNDRAKTGKAKYAANNVKVDQPLTTPSYVTTTFELSHEDENAKQAARGVVLKLFKNQDCEWRKCPIVIGSFSMYHEPEGYDDLYLPAEVGLTALSVQEGVLDNYARIIEPGTVPMGYEVEVAETAKRLGVPAPGMVPDFAEFRSIMMIIQSFLEKYRGSLESKDEELYLYALDSDFVMVNRCLEWLFEKSRYPRYPVRVLSLNLFAYLASAAHTRKALSEKKSDLQGDTQFRAPTEGSIFTSVSSQRTVRKPLVDTFVYPGDHPLTTLGLFMSEEEVDNVIKMMDNYKFYEELSCLYHIKKGLQPQNCALTMTNRYAFSLLEILTLSNDVPIQPGGHYPQIDKPHVEKCTRINCLRRWGVTNVESGLILAPAANFDEALDPPVQVERKEKREMKKQVARRHESEQDFKGEYNPYRGDIPDIFRGLPRRD